MNGVPLEMWANDAFRLPWVAARVPNDASVDLRDDVQLNVLRAGEVSQIDVPPGTDLSRYPLVTFSADTASTPPTGAASLGPAVFMLTDSVGSPSHTISFKAKPGLGPDLGVRVGSCTQWRGFEPSQPLYITQSGGAPITSVTLSGATD